MELVKILRKRKNKKQNKENQKRMKKLIRRTNKFNKMMLRKIIKQSRESKPLSLYIYIETKTVTPTYIIKAILNSKEVYFQMYFGNESDKSIVSDLIHRYFNKYGFNITFNCIMSNDFGNYNYMIRITY